jgi:tight adherence protein C
MAIILTAVLLFAGLGLCATPLLARQMAEHGMRQRLASLCGASATSAARGDAEGAFQSLVSRLAMRLGSILVGTGKSRRQMAEELASLGWSDRNAPSLFAGARALAALTLGASADLFSPAGVAMRNGLVVALLAYVLPNIVLSRLADGRKRRMMSEMPVAIDVLIMALESGSGVEQAVRFSTTLQVHPAPLVRRGFIGFVHDLERGTPYDLCLTRLGERLGNTEGELFIEVLRQSLQYGTEIVEPLRTLSNDMRLRRLADARAAVGKAATMMTLVMVTCLMPALITLIGAPAFSSIMRALGGAR